MYNCVESLAAQRYLNESQSFAHALTLDMESAVRRLVLSKNLKDM